MSAVNAGNDIPIMRAWQIAPVYSEHAHPVAPGVHLRGHGGGASRSGKPDPALHPTRPRILKNRSGCWQEGASGYRFHIRREHLCGRQLLVTEPFRRDGVGVFAHAYAQAR